MDGRRQLQERPRKIKRLVRVLRRDAGLDHRKQAGQILDERLLLAPVDIAGRAPK